MFKMASIWDMSQGHADAAIDWSWKEAFQTFNKDIPLYNNNGNSKERRQLIVERKPKFEMNKLKMMGDMKRIPGETKRGNVNPKQSLIEQKQNLDQKQNLMTSTYSSNVSQLTNGILDKRFKTLPPSEMLSRNETLGGYIFVCNNDTMQEDLKRKLFGLPQRYRDSVRAIQPGLPLFLYNYTTHQLHGIFEAASFGGSNIDPTAWEDKKCRGESRFPAQVRTQVRKSCKPLEEDAFRPVLYHYDGPKFRLQLSVPETLKLLDLFMENGSA